MSDPDALATALLRALAARPDGARIDDLAAIARAPTRRTLQRHLRQLADAGRVLVEGRGPATRYRLPPAVPSAAIRHDPATAELLTAIRRPIATRTPVGYDPAFLDDYQPNVTTWIPHRLREHLRALGSRDHDRRPAGTYARAILERLLIDLSWASSHLEGNTYSLLDTRDLVMRGRVAPGRAAFEAQMILNHKAAIEMLVEGADQIGFTPHIFRNLHAVLAENLLRDPGAVGRLRTIPVEIGGSVYIPLAIPSMIEERFARILRKAEAIACPFEQAFFVMVQLPYLQPFEDVTKRVSRIGANIPFIRHNLAPLSFVDVTASDYAEATLVVYEQRRVEALRDLFVWAYERSAMRYGVLKDSLVEPDPLRLAWRTELREVVRTVIIDRIRADADAVAPLLPAHIPADVRDPLIRIVLDEVRWLHDGSIARYRLRPSELTAWREAWPAPP